MRSVVPYLGIAAAVALGIALAPYIGWIALGAVVFLAVGIVLALIQRAYRRVMARLRAWADRTLV